VREWGREGWGRRRREGSENVGRVREGWGGERGKGDGVGKVRGFSP